MNDTVHQLVGRDRELEVLERVLGEACAGSSRFVLVSGEPGIGKSALVAQLARRAEASGCLVLEGRATELERDFPFGLLVDALDDCLASLDARSLDRLAAEELGELASVFPALRSMRPTGAALGTAAERFRAHFAARELLERLAAPRPLLLTLDDLQWSDDASVEFIGHLLRRPPDAAVMLAATIRTGPVPQILAAAIDGASSKPHRPYRSWNAPPWCLSSAARGATPRRLNGNCGGWASRCTIAVREEGGTVWEWLR